MAVALLDRDPDMIGVNCGDAAVDAQRLAYAGQEEQRAECCAMAGQPRIIEQQSGTRSSRESPSANPGLPPASVVPIPSASPKPVNISGD